MIVRKLILFLFCLMLGYATRADDAAESKALEGTWRFVKPSGAEGQKDKLAQVLIIFEGQSIAFVGEETKRAVRGTYTVDASKNPKTMDMTLENGGAKATTLAIYDLDGDTLRLCHYLGPIASKERPKRFLADTRTALGILKREKK